MVLSTIISHLPIISSISTHRYHLMAAINITDVTADDLIASWATGYSRLETRSCYYVWKDKFGYDLIFSLLVFHITVYQAGLTQEAPRRTSVGLRHKEAPRSVYEYITTPYLLGDSITSTLLGQSTADVN